MTSDNFMVRLCGLTQRLWRRIVWFRAASRRTPELPGAIERKSYSISGTASNELLWYLRSRCYGGVERCSALLL